MQAGAIETLAAAVEASLTWRDFANCAGADPEMFFTEQGVSTKPAKQLCKSCVVSAECLEYAQVNGIRVGIWGGLSDRERRKVWRERRQEVA